MTAQRTDEPSRRYVRRLPRPMRAESPPNDGLHLVMLGTRAGPYTGARAAASTALVVDGHIYLVDAGAELVHRFYQSGLAFREVRGLFVTHLHSDHISGIFPFFNSNFAHWDYGNQQIAVIGPGRADETSPDGTPALADAENTLLIAPDCPTPGIVEMIEKLYQANAYDLNNGIRTVRRSGNRPMDITGTNGPGMLLPQAIALPSHATLRNHTPDMDPIEVFHDDHVRVTAILVNHPPVFPAWAFRFETRHGSVTFSGDTAPCPNLISLARESDVLVHEVMSVTAAIAKHAGTDLEETMRIQCTTAHTPLTTTDTTAGEPVMGVGAVATAARARGLVLNHLYPDDGSISEHEFYARARSEFGGALHVSDDLDVIDVAAFLGDRR